MIFLDMPASRFERIADSIDNGNLVFILIAIIIVVVVAAAVIIMRIIRKNKKEKMGNTVNNTAGQEQDTPASENDGQ